MVDKINFTVYQGADFRRVMEFRDEAGALLDLTGYEFRGQLRESFAGQVALSIIFTVRDQATQLGVVDMHITSESTSALPIVKSSDYIYDIEMVDASGEVRRVMEGKIKIHPEVTR